MPSKFIEKYNIFAGRKWTKIISELNLTMLAKRTQDTLDTVAIRPITTGLQGRKLGFQEQRPQLLRGPGSNLRLDLAKPVSGHGHRMNVPFVHSVGLTTLPNNHVCLGSTFEIFHDPDYVSNVFFF